MRDLSWVKPVKADPYPYNELQLKWLADLDEGKPSANLKLESDGGHCCLGRLHVVAGSVRHLLGKEVSFSFSGDKAETAGVGLYLREASRLTSPLGGFYRTLKPEPETALSCLASLNDGGWTHQEIAAYIRLDPWNVFGLPDSWGAENAA